MELKVLFNGKKQNFKIIIVTPYKFIFHFTKTLSSFYSKVYIFIFEVTLRNLSHLN
jgi:hypothetical protein